MDKKQMRHPAGQWEMLRRKVKSFLELMERKKFFFNLKMFKEK